MWEYKLIVLESNISRSVGSSNPAIQLSSYPCFYQTFNLCELKPNKDTALRCTDDVDVDGISCKHKQQH